MKRALAIAAAVIVVLVGGVLVAASLQPDALVVSRSTTIQAPPEAIYPLIADFKRWRAWSPYEDKDPGMRRSFAGAESGVGAAYAWEGDGEVGAGRMEIVEAAPPGRVTLQLDFSRPFEAHNSVDFTLAPKPGGTEAAWTMRGPMPFLSKVMCLFIDMDQMIGADFEKGLANLKAVAEKQARSS